MADDRPAPSRKHIIAAVATIAAVCAVAAIALAIVLAPSPEDAARSQETRDLAAALSRVRSTISPIARDWSSRPQTAPIDIGAYRRRIASARVVVIAVNDVPVETRPGLEARDLIMSGGALVLDGLDEALDALTADDRPAVERAGETVSEGTAMLDEAHALLEGGLAGGGL